MKRDSGVLIATVGTVFLAVMCCVGLPLLAAGVAAVGVGALFGGGLSLYVTVLGKGTDSELSCAPTLAYELSSPSPQAPGGRLDGSV